jgi:type II secretory pathway predicted ATPase ExeA
MYERFYGLTERPFSLLPDPDFLFLGEKHQTALDLLELTIFNQTGFCVVSGEIGAGKTTLVRELLNRLQDDICVGLISNTHPSFGELLQWIMAAFDLHSESTDQFELHKRFLDFVIQQYSENKRTLLIIDEAQNLSVSAMEELRMLSNVNSDRDLVLQVILVGQSQLRDKLQLPELQQFAQRIGADYHLTGLDEQETFDYIRYRVTHAGGSADLFSEDACRTVYRCSDGIPRLINGICDLCLVYGYSDKSARITPELVREVVNDQRGGHIRSSAGRLSSQAGAQTAHTAAASAPTEGAAFVEPESTAQPQAESASSGLPAGQMPDPQKKASKREGTRPKDTSAETIVGAMEAMLLQQPVVAAGGNGEAGLPGRHGPVAEEKPAAGNSDEKAVAAIPRLVMGLVLLMSLVVAGWLSWRIWDERSVAETTVAADSAAPAVPSTAADNSVIDPLTQENANIPLQRREAERLQQERQAAEKRLTEQRELERLERERLAEQREAEREAKRAAALAAWKKANSGIGWAEEIEEDEEE